MNDAQLKEIYGVQLYKHADEKNLLYILAYIADTCNYKCEYCYNAKPYSGILLNLDGLYEYIAFIAARYHRRYIQLELIGGEPTLHPGLLNFCSRLNRLRNVKVKIFTNLSAGVNVYEKLLINGNTTIIASWHGLNADKNNLEFRNKIMQLAETHKEKIECRIMYESENSDAAMQTAETLVNVVRPDMFDLSLVFCPGTKNNAIQGYSPEQEAAFKKFHDKHQVRSNRPEFMLRYSDGSEQLTTFTQMFCNKEYSFKKWLCNAGQNSLYIDYMGWAYPCVEYSYSEENRIFNIYDKSTYFNYAFRPVICKLDYCSCDWDIKKRRIFNT